MDASGRQVDEPTPCAGCGYDLRGLLETDRCPECGAPVTHSTGGDRLVYCSIEFLQVVRRGVGLILLAQPLVAISWLLPLLQVFATSARTPSSGIARWLVVLIGGVQVVYVWGHWRFFWREPRFTGVREPFGVRRLGLVSVFVSTALWPLPMVIEAFVPGIWAGLSEFTRVVLLSLAPILAWGFQMYIVMRYVYALAERVPNERTVQLAGLQRGLLPFLTAFLACIPMIVWLNRSPFSLLGCFAAVPVSFFAVILQVMYWSTLSSLFGELGRTLAIKRRLSEADTGRRLPVSA